MRIRTIKPEFYRSDDITALSREHRLLFIGLWSYVDDNGVGIDDYRAIVADLFAFEDDQKEVRDYVREGLAILSRALLIYRYEVDGKRYLYISGWERHQRVDRPNRARFPKPPDDFTPPTSDDDPNGPPRDTDSRHPRDTLATVSPPGTEEQGNRGEQELLLAARATDPEPTPTPPSIDPLDRFPEFYAAYPRRVQRRDAEKAWRAAIRRKVDPDLMIAAARRYATAVHDTDPRFVKHPASWLNAGAYDDAPPPMRAVAGGYQPYRNPDQSAYDQPDPWGTP